MSTVISANRQLFSRPPTANRSRVPAWETAAFTVLALMDSGTWASSIFKLFTCMDHDNVYPGQRGARKPAIPIACWGGWSHMERRFCGSRTIPTIHDFIAIGRYELIRMSRQANSSIPGNAGNLDTWTVGYRWYPIMSPRAGLAWVQEYSHILNPGAAPLTGKDDSNSSYLMGLDFDF